MTLEKVRTGTKGDVGSVTGSLTLSSVIGGNFSNAMLVWGNLINLAPVVS